MADQMKTCKDCGTEVSKSAKTCPKCGAKLKGGAGKIILIIVAVVVVLGVIGAIAGGSGGSSSSSGSSTTSTTSSASATADAHANDVVYQASNKKFETVEEGVLDADATFGYPTVEGTIKNISGKKISYAQIEVNFYDASGAQIGSSLDNINNLEADGTWKYKVQGFEKGAESFKISEITSW